MYTDSGEHIFSDSQVAALRMTIAGVVLLPFAIRSLKNLESVKEVVLLLVVGLSGNFFPAFLFTYAETGISSGYAGMLNSFTPIFALIIGFVIFKERLSRVQVVGVAIGTIGVVLLMLAGSRLYILGGWSHIFAIVLATFFYGVSLNTIKYTLQKFNSIQITSLAFFLILLPSIVISIYNGAFKEVVNNEFAVEGMTYLTVLSVVGTAFAVMLFNKLVAMSSVLFASSVTYLIPVVAVVIGIAYNESISFKQIGAMGIIFTGVFIANYLPKMKRFTRVRLN